MNYYGFMARMGAVLHKILHPHHELVWRTNIDEICSGDITCETCNKLYWCRAQELSSEELIEKINT